MKYAACIKNVESNAIELLPVGEKVDDHDPRYAGSDYHIIPCPSDLFIYGCHDISRDCACHPEVRNQYGRSMVIHSERVN